MLSCMLFASGNNDDQAIILGPLNSNSIIIVLLFMCRLRYNYCVPPSTYDESKLRERMTIISPMNN